VTKQRIQGLAASNAVVRNVAPAIPCGDEMLDTCVGSRQWMLTEEAQTTLGE
jgi:hypothetical protein